MISRFIVATTIAFASTSASAATIYVKANATGTGDGTSWANARTSLSEAIGAATAGDQVWVAAGTYGTISLKNGVKVYGGFAGTETAASQSNPDVNVTTINGSGSRAVSGNNCGSTTLLRGFHITGGYAGGAEFGGGLELKSSSALIVRCTFSNNGAQFVGAATHVFGGAPTFVNCKFHRNNGSSSGGGVFLQRDATPSFVNCLFFKHEAEEAGALAITDATPTFINCTFADNKATVGTGWAASDNGGRAILRNCIVWHGDPAAPTNNHLWNNPSTGGTTTVVHSDVRGGWTGTANINADPLFVDPANDDYRLCGTTQSPSPCKDVGSNSYLPADVADLDWDGNTTESIPIDLAGNARIMNSTVDMGAYERGTGVCTGSQ